MGNCNKTSGKKLWVKESNGEDLGDLMRTIDDLQ